LILGDSIDAPDAIHDLEFIAVDLLSEVVTDDGPVVAIVVTAKYLVSSEVKTTRSVLADLERGIPVPYIGIFILALFRLYADLFTALAIIAHEDAILRLRIDDVRILRVYL